MIMKDPMVQEIHRRRADYAKRFNCDVRAIGEDIRRSEAETGGKFAAKPDQIGLGRRCVGTQIL